MADKLDAEKKELSLSINSFDQPTELVGVDAWAKLVANLLFMKKGSYPTDPEMGCELQQYEFSVIDEVTDEVQEVISEQVRTYLPDIPLDTVSVTKDYMQGGQRIMLTILEFSYNDGEIHTPVVAAEKSNNLINFEVVI